MTLVPMLLFHGGAPTSVHPGSRLPGSGPDCTAPNTGGAVWSAGTREWAKGWRTEINPLRPRQPAGGTGQRASLLARRERLLRVAPVGLGCRESPGKAKRQRGRSEGLD